MWSCSPPAPEPITSDMVSITYDIKRSTYDVVGVTSIDIHDSMKENSPECDLDEGFSEYYAEGCFVVDYSPSKSSFDIEELSDGACIVNSLHINYDLEIILPNHLYPDSMDQRFQTLWKNKVRSVASHEQIHLDIALEQLNRLRTAFTEQLYDRYDECDEMTRVSENIMNNWESTYNQAQKDFDDTDSEKCDSKTNRLEIKVDSLDSELDDLIASMNVYESEIDSIDTKIESDEAEIKKYKLELSQINTRLDESNRTLNNLEKLGDIKRYNQLVPTYNNLLKESNAASRKYDLLFDESNRLIDQYNSMLDKYNDVESIYTRTYKEYSHLFDEYLWICD